MFIHFNNFIRSINTITYVDCNKYVSEGEIRVYFTNGTSDFAKGAEATNLIMALCPAVLEGKRARHAKHSWAIHNLIGHPLMQIFSWLHLTALGIKIHDLTVPEPKNNE